MTLLGGSDLYRQSRAMLDYVAAQLPEEGRAWLDSLSPGEVLVAGSVLDLDGVQHFVDHWRDLADEQARASKIWGVPRPPR